MKSPLKAFAAGTLAGCLFVAVLLLLDIGGLASLIAHDPSARLVIAMLLLQIGAMFGIAVMVSSPGKDEKREGHRTAQKTEFSPALAARRLRSPSR